MEDGNNSLSYAALTAYKICSKYIQMVHLYHELLSHKCLKTICF